MVVRPDYGGSFPDAEDVVKSILGGVEVDGAPVPRVGRETPAGKALGGPAIRVERISGSPNADRTADFPVVEVAYFGRDFDQTKAMQRSAGRLFEAAIGHVHGGTVVQGARVENGPLRPPWSSADSGVRRALENWRITYPPIFD